MSTPTPAPRRSGRRRHRLLSPAVALMNRLRYPQKFVLISLLFALPLAMVMYFLVSEINDRIRFAQKEMHGDAYLRALRVLLQHVTESQIIADDYMTRGVRHRPDLIRKQAQIDEDAKALDAVQRELGAVLATRARYDVLSEDGGPSSSGSSRSSPAPARICTASSSPTSAG